MIDGTYTYDPSDIAGRTVSHVRFALGDIMTEGESATCMLADEEIQALLDTDYKLKRVLFLLADAVYMRLSYETDWTDDGTSFDLSQRADRWKALRDKFEKDAGAAECVPTSGAVKASVSNPNDGGHYFYGDMLRNERVQPPYPYRGDKGC